MVLNDLTAKYSGLNAEEIGTALYCEVKSKLHRKYGEKPDCSIQRRVNAEWTAMEQSGVILDAAALYELTAWLKKNQSPYWMRGFSGSSFILYLLEITDGNPLPPHLYCPKCKSVQWEPLYVDGFDIPQDYFCDKDGTLLIADGHNIPWQTLLGFDGFQATFDIDLPSNVYEDFQETLGLHWLSKIKSESSQSISHKSGVKHLKISNLSLMFILDTNTSASTFYNRKFAVPDQDCIMRHWKLLIGCSSGNDVGAYKPHDVADVIAMFGLIHSTGVWDEVTALMIDQLGYSLSDMIAFQDDVYQYLIDHDVIEKDAWRAMRKVRVGQGLPFVVHGMMQARDKWVLARCEQVKYLFPKAHAVEYILFKLKLVDFDKK